MIRTSLKNPYFIIVIFTVLLITGFISLRELPIDLFPNISLPMLSVVTFYPGAGPEEVEKQITELIEDAASTLPNLKKIRSISQENLSAVTLEFEWGTDLNEAANDLRPKLDLLKNNLPQDATSPEILKFDVSMFPILLISMSSEDENFDLRKFFEDKVKDEIERVPGVGQTQLWGGGKKKIIKVEIKRENLEYYGIDLNSIANSIKYENMNIPVGEVESNSKLYTVRIPGEFNDIKEIENLTIFTSKGVRLRLGDIAVVKFDYERPTSYVRRNGKPSLLIGVLKQANANTVRVSEGVKKKIREIEEKYKGEKISFVELFDSSKFIIDSILSLTKTIILAAILVIIVTFLLLRNIRSGIIISITIPVSLIVSFIFLYLTNSSINLISLSSLAIAIGMVVDNAVVVLENIFYHRERGEGKKESAIFGAQEVGRAITASTLTTVAVFLPILMAKGLVSIMFKQLAITISLVLLVSLFTAFTLTPVLSFKFLKIKEKKGISKKISDFLENLYKPLEIGYNSFLNFALNHKLMIFSIGTIIFILGIIPFLTGFLKTEFFPEADTGQIRGNFVLPSGTKLENTDKITKKFEDYIEKNIPEVRIFGVRTGRTEGGWGSLMGMQEGDNTGFISLRLLKKSERKRTSQEISHILNKKLKEIPGIVQGSFEVSGGFTQSLLIGSPIEIKIFGYDIKETDSIGNYLKEKLEKIRGISGLNISRGLPSQELVFKYNRNILNHYGVPSSYLATYLRGMIEGIKAGSFRKKGEEIEIVVRIDEESRRNINILRSSFIKIPNGKLIPIENFGEFKEEKGPVRIERENRERVLKITGNFYGRSLNEVIEDIKKVISEMNLPEYIRIEIGGSISQQKESFSFLFFSLIIGIILVYLVMVAQFSSFLHPFVIMFSVPFAFTGVSFAHLIAGIPFSLTSFIGLVMLIGIVVNNAIVLVDYINILRKRNYKLLDAVKEAGKRRLRPIIITTTTTLFGLLPLALSRAEGSEAWRPLGISVIGGLFLSAFISLIIVPIVYVFIEKIKGEKNENASNNM